MAIAGTNGCLFTLLVPSQFVQCLARAYLSADKRLFGIFIQIPQIKLTRAIYCTKQGRMCRRPFDIVDIVISMLKRVQGRNGRCLCGSFGDGLVVVIHE